MEKEINIAEILKDKPRGLKLWSPIFGDCVLGQIDEGNNEIEINIGHQALWTFAWNGHTSSYPENGEVMLFPSKLMRDWSKFTWKRGDVLQSNDNQDKCIFEKFIDDEYKKFKARHLVSQSNVDIRYIGNFESLSTSKYNILPIDSLERLVYIGHIEEKLGGKLNMETLEIEPSKPKWTPKPFDKVLVRNNPSESWRPAFFHKYSNIIGNIYPYITIGGKCYRFCKLYEGNEDLLND